MKSIKYVVCLALVMGFAISASAITFTNYGDFAAQDVDFLQVTEQTFTLGDTVPKYGMPIVTTNSNTMDFNPVGFSATAAGAGDVDYTDGNLVFQIESRGLSVIEQVGFSEAGFYSLLGPGTDTTKVNVTANLILEVYEVNNVAVTPVQDSYSLTFSPGDGLYEMITDGAGSGISWSGSVLVDVNALLAENGYGVNDYATKVSVDLNNELSAFSEDGTLATISKKDFDVGVSIEVIPEPGTAMMLAGAFAGVAFIRRRLLID